MNRSFYTRTWPEPTTAPWTDPSTPWDQPGTAPWEPQPWPELSSPNNLVGWECPVCGRGNAPTTSTCPCYYDGRVTTSTET